MKSFLVRCSESQLKAIDRNAKAQGMSRNKYVIDQLLPAGQATKPNRADFEHYHPPQLPPWERQVISVGDITCPHKYRVQKGPISVCARCGAER